MYNCKNYKLIGATLQRGLVVSLALSVFVTILWIVTEPLLLLLHQDEVVAELTKHYVWGMLPGLWFSNGLTVLQKYLQGQGIMYPSIICGVVLNIANGIFNFVLVHGVTSSGGIGVVGCGLSTSISKFFATALLLLWIKKFELYKGTWFGFSYNECFGWDGLREYLKLAIPAGAQMVFEGCAFEILTVLAGLFGAIELDGHSIAMNFTLLTFMLPFSVSIALSVRIGQLLGQKNAEMAKKSTRIGYFITMSFMVLISLFQFSSRHWIGRIYTNKQEVLDLVAKILPISALFQFFDGFQTTCQGVIRGTGKNKIGAIVNFGAFYIIGMPFSVVFAFAFHLQVLGLWWGLCIGLASAAVVLGIVVVRIDWDNEVKVALARTATFEDISNVDVEMQNGADINNEDDEFERFNREKSEGSLGEAILNSKLNGYSALDQNTTQEDDNQAPILSRDYVKLNNSDSEQDIYQNINSQTVSIMNSSNSDNEEDGGGSKSDVGSSAILN
ncbi:hypothetical protein DICPUDRAFT_76595 [Dictyostelium purpureum]|uniref:Multidrug and toxin extrusion protein n=1 Tax=Dictyostelium purpureum TaxID=5786 RepID=F0ZE29_DICPU|nr:uncharacterized protein DICPUDRAFT_76595 [Dictyostelium purpureum]EGC37837.1 hypothetical protein DICPUDRAFT_76595 [Dictyostelium purpureum]|eukprot:XP_003285682.1 hypothetical protein DICPUDRAFT_76595 [Dictyostelium purpureum]